MFHRRLLLLTETFPPSIGGLQQYVSGLVSALPPENVRVIAPLTHGAKAWDAQQRYPIRRVRMSGWMYPRWRPALKVLQEEVLQYRPDVLVCGKALFEGRAALALHSLVPYVVLTYGMEIRTWLQGWKTRRDLLHVLRHAARVVVINADTKGLLLRAGVPERIMVKIYPGVREMFFQPIENAENVRARYDIRGRPLMTTICRLVPRKGVDLIVRALPETLKTVPGLTYCVIGEGPERKRLEDLARSLGLREHVSFLGGLPQEDVRRILVLSDLFVLTPRETPNDVEGFGIVYLEAAASGVSAIGSRTGGVPEAVLDGETGLLVRPDDVRDTARAIMRLLTDERLRAHLASAARERAEREFTWSKRAFLFRGMIEAVVREAGTAVQEHL